MLPESLKEFVRAAGISKSNSLIEPAFLEHFIRDDLNRVSKRVMAVLNPLPLEITNFDGEEEVLLEDYPQNEQTTSRKYYFGKNLLIEKEDFIKEPDPKFYRLYVGAKVRLKGAYIVTCTGFDEDENGNVTKVYAEYDPETKSGTNCTVKVKGTIHWINPNHAEKIEVRLFDNLVEEESAELVEGQERAVDDYKINPNSIITIENAYIEDNLNVNFEERYQFMRNGYFCLDKDSTEDKKVFNRTITLKETKKTK